MKFIFLGHACFQIDTGKEKLLFDPFLTGNGLAEEAASKVECDYIFLSQDRKSTRLNSSHNVISRMPSSA